MHYIHTYVYTEPDQCLSSLDDHIEDIGTVPHCGDLTQRSAENEEQEINEYGSQPDLVNIVRGRSGSTSDHTISSSMNSFPFFAGNPNPSVTAESEIGQVSNPSQISHIDTHRTLTLASSPSIVRGVNSKSNPSPSPSANLPSLRRSSMRVGRSPLPSLVLGETLTQQPDRVWGRNTKHVHDINPYPYTLTSTPTTSSKPLSVSVSAHPNLHLLSTSSVTQSPTTAAQAAALAEASVRALTSLTLPPTVTSMYVEGEPNPPRSGEKRNDNIEAAALNFIRQRGQVDLPSDEGKGETLPESPYSQLRYTPYVGGTLTSSESALVQEIQALVAINSQLNEAVEQAEQQQRDEQVRSTLSHSHFGSVVVVY